MKENYFKYKWQEKLNSFFGSISNIVLYIAIIALIGYIIYRIIPYHVGKTEFYEKEFYKNHPNF